MLENQAALKIQGLFTSHRLKKQSGLQQTIANSPNSQLLQAIHLRFQCMRAVAAAKFPLNKRNAGNRYVMKLLIFFYRQLSAGCINVFSPASPDIHGHPVLF